MSEYRETKKTKRILAAAMSLAMLLTAIPSLTLRADEAGGANEDVRTADGSTAVGGYESFLSISDNTLDAGRVWTDKSVYAINTDGSFSVDMDNKKFTYNVGQQDDFLEVFSALGSSAEVVVEEDIPMDVMFVLDMSGSMGESTTGQVNDVNTTRLKHAVDALNDAFKYLQEQNDYNRVGLCVYSGEGNYDSTFWDYYIGRNETDAGSGLPVLALGRYSAPGDKYFSVAGEVNPHSTYPEEKTGKVGQVSMSVNVVKDDKVSGEKDTLIDDEPLIYNTLTREYHRLKDKIRAIGATNTQLGLYTAMEMMANENNRNTEVTINGEQVTRRPVVILITDGIPTISYSGEEWWNPDFNIDAVQGFGSEPYSYGNYMLAMATASYMKRKVNDHYYGDPNATGANSALIYTFGIYLTDATEQEIAEAFLNPKDNYNSTTNETSKQIKEAWEDGYLKDESVVIEVNDPSTHDWKYSIPPAGHAYQFEWNIIESTKQLYQIDGQQAGPAGENSYYIYSLNTDRDPYFDEPPIEGVNGKYITGYYTLKHPPEGTDDIDNLIYNDGYRDIPTNADISDTIITVLKRIHDPVTLPIEGQNDITADSGEKDMLSYSDPIGDYMELKDVRQLWLFDEEYEIRKDTDGYYAVDSSGDRDAEITNPYYKDIDVTFKLSDIKIWVDKEESTYSTDDDHLDRYILHVDIPVAALPVRIASVTSGFTHNGSSGNATQVVLGYDTDTAALPLRLFYTVGMQEKFLKSNGSIDLSTISEEYKGLHRDPDTNRINFYSNYYSNYDSSGDYTYNNGNVRDHGDAFTTFSPSDSNRYYINQEYLPLYTGDGSYVTTYDENGEYYFYFKYYTSDSSEPQTIKINRTGAMFGDGVPGNNKSDSLVWYNLQTKAFVELTDAMPAADTGTWVVAVRPGGVRVGDMGDLSGDSETQKSANETATSNTYYLPTVSENTATGNVIITNYLGNNGVRSADGFQIDFGKDETQINGEDVETTLGDDGKLHGRAVNVGDKITYEITWTNDATEIISGKRVPVSADIIITDTLDDGVSFVDASDGGVYDKGTVTWTIENAFAGASGKVTLTVEVTKDALKESKGNTVENQANIDVKNGSNIDTKVVENPVDAPVIDIKKKQAVNDGEKTDVKLTVNGNDEVTYYITVENIGSVTAVDVIVTDEIPAGLELVKGSISDSGTETDNIIEWKLGNIEPGDLCEVSFKVTVPVVDEYKIWENFATESFRNDPENPAEPDPNEPDGPHKGRRPKDSNKVEIEETPEPEPPELEIEKFQAVNGGIKTQAKQTVNAGDKVTYYIKVTNTGDVTAENVVITDDIPEGLTLVEDSISHNGKKTDDTIVWEFDLLGGGADVTVSFTVTVPAVEKYKSWENFATESFGNDPENPTVPDPNEPDGPHKGRRPKNSNKVEIEEYAPALSIVKTQAVNDGTPTDKKLTVNGGDEVTYYIKVTNTGDITAEGVAVTDEIPAGLTLVDGSISDDGEKNGDTIEWTLGSLAVGASREVSFTVTVPEVEEYKEWKNIAETSFDNDPENPAEPDPNEPEGPHKGRKHRPSNEVVIEEGTPELKIEKTQSVNNGTPTDKKLTVNGGDEVTYYIKVTNTGDITAEGVAVTDEIPAGLTLVDGSISDDGKKDGDTIEWTLGSLAVGASREVSFTVTVPEVEEYKEWKNIAETSFDNDPENPAEPDPNEPEGPHKGRKHRPSNEVVIEEGTPELKIEKTQSVNNGTPTDKKLTVNGGDEVTYYIKVTNTGDITAEGVVVTDEIPAGLTLVDGSISDDGKKNGDTIEWTLGSLAVGASREVSFTMTVPEVEEYKEWKNIAETSFDNDPENPTEPDPNEPEGPHKGRKHRRSNEVVIEEGTPELKIEKTQSVNNGTPTDKKLMVNGGDKVTYYIKVTNTGDITAEGVVVTDEIPAGLTLVDGSISDNGKKNGNTIEWTLGSIEAGASREVSFTVTVPEVEEYKEWKNIAETSFDNDPENPAEPDPNEPDGPHKGRKHRRSNEVVIEEGTPELKIEKTQSVNNGTPTDKKLTVNGGDTVTYYIKVTNTGIADAEDVVVTDEVPAGLKLGAIGKDGTLLSDRKTIAWEIGTLAAGADVTVSFTVIVPKVDKRTEWRNIAVLSFGNDPDNPPEDPDDPIVPDPDDPHKGRDPKDSNEVVIEEIPEPAPKPTPKPTPVTTTTTPELTTEPETTTEPISEPEPEETTTEATTTAPPVSEPVPPPPPPPPVPVTSDNNFNLDDDGNPRGNMNIPTDDDDRFNLDDDGNPRGNMNLPTGVVVGGSVGLAAGSLIVAALAQAAGKRRRSRKDK